MKNTLLRATPLLATALLLGACASPPPAAPAIAAGTASVNAAVASNAGNAGAPEVSDARDKLEQARAIAKSYPRASTRLAEEADVDAQLAAAKARAERAQRAAAEAEASVQTLRDDMRRAATPQPVRP